ncbi:MAG: type I-E CRISPR-associated protein Cas5/CasD, partial [Thermodesulfobacteriota bacterium]
GVVGLVAAAMGRDRTEPIDDLAALRFGVRVDREGVVKEDYHTAGGKHQDPESYGVAKANGSKPLPALSWRYYLHDAAFLVGLEGDEDLLRRVHSALLAPKYPIFLGRMSCVPSPPPVLIARPGHLTGAPDIPGLISMPLEEALTRGPWTARSSREKKRALKTKTMRLSLEVPLTESDESRPDVPLSFETRIFGYLGLRTMFVPLTADLVMEV